MTAPEHRDFVQGEVRDYMREVATLLHDTVPEGFGFTLLVFSLNKGKAYMNYMSDACREDMIVALKELIANFEGSGHAPPRRTQ